MGVVTLELTTNTSQTDTTGQEVITGEAKKATMLTATVRNIASHQVGLLTKQQTNQAVTQ